MKTETPQTPHSETPDPKRSKLLAMFERLNLPVTMFDSLRSDAYEKDVAKQSVAQLEQVYLTLFNPGEACAEIQEQLPRWTDGKHAGRRPSINTLMKIKNRIMAQHVADDLDEHVEQMNSLLNRLSGLPADLRKDVYDLMMTVLGEELFKAKFNGKKLMEHMPVVKCIMKDKEMKMRERESAERLALQKSSKELQKSRLELEQKKFEFQVKQATPEPAPVKKELEPYDPVAAKAKVHAMINRMYGLTDDVDEIRDPKSGTRDPKLRSVSSGPKDADKIPKSNRQVPEKATPDKKFSSPPPPAGPVSVWLSDPSLVAAEAAQKAFRDAQLKQVAEVESEPDPAAMSPEEYQRRLWEKAEHEAWVRRQMAIRDRDNGSEVRFNPYV
jgi:hypothetical protein